MHSATTCLSHNWNERLVFFSGLEVKVSFLFPLSCKRGTMWLFLPCRNEITTMTLVQTTCSCTSSLQASQKCLYSTSQHVYIYMYMKKSGGPEQKGILRTAVLSLLTLISTVQHNLFRDPRGLCMTIKNGLVHKPTHCTCTCTMYPTWFDPSVCMHACMCVQCAYYSDMYMYTLLHVHVRGRVHHRSIGGCSGIQWACRQEGTWCVWCEIGCTDQSGPLLHDTSPQRCEQYSTYM